MTRVEPSIELWGKAFVPSRVTATKGIRFSQSSDPGSLGVTGKYRGIPLPYGSATIAVPLGLETEENKIRWVANEFKKLLGSEEALGIETAFFHLQVFYSDQCNFDLTPESLSSISATKLSVTVSAERE